MPDGWEVVNSPIPRGGELDLLLQGTDPGDPNVVHSWDEIRHAKSGTRIMLRMAPPEVRDGKIVNDGARVTGVVVLPSEVGERVTAADMRFPLGAIESAANLRRIQYLPDLKTLLSTGGYEPPAPVGKPDGTDAFYGRVAALWRYFVDEPNPTEKLREVNGIPLSTAQRWVTEARKRRMLPPGRRGRAK